VIVKTATADATTADATTADATTADAITANAIATVDAITANAIATETAKTSIATAEKLTNFAYGNWHIYNNTILNQIYWGHPDSTYGRMPKFDIIQKNGQTVKNSMRQFYLGNYKNELEIYNILLNDKFSKIFTKYNYSRPDIAKFIQDMYKILK
jgi:hypothetical protein